MLLLRLLLLAVATSSTGAYALPSVPFSSFGSTDTYPEFIPSPGFPSLASLNLTTEMLRVVPKDLVPLRNALKARNDCGQGRGFVTANVDDVIVCFNFLVALNDYIIAVTSANTDDGGVPGTRQVAYYGTAFVNAIDLLGTGVEAYSYQVADAVQWVFTYCNSGGQVGGEATAYNNQYMNVISSGEE